MLVMRKTLLLQLVAILCFCPSLVLGADSEENLALRRINLLYQEKEYAYLSRAIDEFFQKFPESLDRDRLIAMLGDIAYADGDFERALEYYSKVPELAFKGDCRRKKWHTLFSLGRFEELIEETKLYAEKNESALFYLAEGTLELALKDLKRKKELLDEALSLFSKLLKSPEFKIESKEALLGIYKEMGRDLEMNQTLHELAHLLLEDNARLHESLSLKIGTLLAKKSPEIATRLFNRLVEEGNEKKKEGAVLLFSLLAKEKNLHALLSHEATFLKLLPQEQLALFNYVVGKLEYAKKDYKSSYHHLLKARLLPLTDPYDKEAYLLLASASKEIGIYEGILEAYQEFGKRYPNDEAILAKLELTLGSYLSEQGKFSEAESYLDRAISRSHGKESGYLEKIRLLSQAGALDKAEELARSYLEGNPKSKKMHEARIALLSQMNSADEKIALRRMEAFRSALENADLFEPSEKLSIELALIKATLSIGNIKDALRLLDEMEKRGENAEEYYALAMFANLKAGNLKKGIEYGEKAILDNNSATNLYLPLFNAYLNLAKETHSREYESSASRILLKAVESNIAVSDENRLWLFYRLAEKGISFGDVEASLSAKKIIEPFLENAESLSQYECEAIMTASLYSLLGEGEKGLTLLKKIDESLYAKGEGERKEEWGITQAEILLSLQKRDEALECFKKLENSKNRVVANHARLQIVRFTRALHNDRRRHSGEAIEKAICTLSEIKNMRNADSEPLHLQAAIELAEMTARLYPPGEREKKLLAFVIKIKEDFTAKDDLASREYHELLEKNPTKRAIYLAYMHYIDGWILALTSECAREESQKSAKRKEADLILSSLDQEAPLYLRSKLKSMGKG